MKPFLIITGMHRSGTSFLVRALNLYGVYLGELSTLVTHEWKYVQENPRGHWENKKILDLTNKTFEFNNCSWHQIKKNIIINKEIGKEIRNVVNEFSKNNSLAAGIKDPRLILCLDSWSKYLPKDIVIVGIFRNPLKVAESLKIRDHFEYEKSLELWKTYNKKLIDILEKNNGFLLNFDWPKDRLFSEINFVASKLGLFKGADLSEWYTEDLFRSDKTYEKKFPLDKEIEEIYSKLIKLSERNKTRKIKNYSHTTAELHDGISELLLQIQTQGTQFKKLNDENVKKIEKLHDVVEEQKLKNIESIDPLSILLQIFYDRSDLREKFGEVLRGNYDNLVEWAVDVCQGKYEEEKAKKRLEEFFEIYVEQFKNKKLRQDFEALNISLKNKTDELSKNKIKFAELQGKLADKIDQLDVTKSKLADKKDQLDVTKSKLADKKDQLVNTEKQLVQKNHELTNAKKSLEEINSSFTYSRLKKFFEWLDRNFPPNTRRGEFLKLFKLGVIVLKQEGFKALFRDFRVYSNLYGLENTLTFKPASSNLDQEYGKRNQITTNYFLKILDSNNKSKRKLERPTVDIIIPIFNAYELVVKCVNSVLKHSENCRILIVNDASTDRRVDKFLNQLSSNPKKKIDIFYLKNSKNLGFVKTVNKAYKQIKNHFVILNSDTEVSLGWLDRLFAPILERENQVSSVTPFSNSTTIFSFPEFHKDNELFKGLDPEIIDSYFQKYGLPEYVEVPTGGGFCMAINEKVSKKIGMFDEIFGKGFGEENDWCQRARKLGFKNVIATNIFVFHNHGTSFSSEEKRQLQIQNSKIISKRYPHYDEEIQNFIAKDPLKPLREILSIIIDSFTKEKAKLVLIVDHNLGGGAIQFSDKIYEELRNDANILQIKYDYNNKTILLNYHGYVNKKLRLENTNPEILLSKIISFFNVDHILVNQVITWRALELLSIIKQSNVSYSVYMHDYFPICPSWNLINFEGNFCGIPEISKCKECLDKNTSEYADYKYFYPNEKFNMIVWRKEFFEFLSHAEQIICFSESSKKLLLKAYDKLTNIKVIEHCVTIENQIKKSKHLHHDRKILTVAIPGAISYLKGEKIIQDLVKHPEFKNMPIKIIILGYTREKLSEKKNKLIVHGKYEIEELPSLLNSYDVDVIFIPSVCPETFSFTTSEAHLLGYPVICFDLGAPADRVKKYNAGIVIEKIDVNNVIKVFKEIIKNPSMLDEYSKNALKYSSPSFSKHLESITEKI